MPNIQHKRGTRAALDALAASSSLVPWQVYAISDESRLALALTTSTYQTFLKTGEGGGAGYYEGPTAPDPATYPLWFNTTAGAFLVYVDSTWVEIGGGSSGGTVTSVGMSVPTGLTVSGSPITSSGTLAVTFDAGYSIPTTAKQSEWDGKEPAISKAIGYAKWNGSAWAFVNETYLTSYTETDPTVPAHVKGISGADISNWNAAFGWGDHASAGYLTSAAIGSSVQAYSANLTSWAALATSAKQDAITISATAPVSPTLNQLWFDIS